MELTAVKNLSSGGGLKVEYYTITTENIKYGRNKVMDLPENLLVLVHIRLGNYSSYEIVPKEGAVTNLTGSINGFDQFVKYSIQNNALYLDVNEYNQHTATTWLMILS